MRQQAVQQRKPCVVRRAPLEYRRSYGGQPFAPTRALVFDGVEAGQGTDLQQMPSFMVRNEERPLICGEQT